MMMVFPARAGMSPLIHAGAGHLDSVPRASGDEPKKRAGGEKLGACSPRERG